MNTRGCIKKKNNPFWIFFVEVITISTTYLYLHENSIHITQHVSVYCVINVVYGF